ncbi:MAG TPA: 50S ribosomal protein L15 [Acholeplasmatales bacterium]|nr:MAG: 50S ribosomal protein L15 [Tenericutes bacterium GWF2_57_13]HAQ57163.1 50S ribosomal protein L15 [Acholeplasmatales bacterium]
MKLNEMKHVDGATHSGKRKGRGTSSGNGKTAGRGQKGQKSRSGGNVRPGFEGGQTPLFKRLPKRGFTNFSQKVYATINVSDLAGYPENTMVNPELLLRDGLVKNVVTGIKILGNGSLNVKLTVQAHKFTATAKSIIEAAGGQIEVI